MKRSWVRIRLWWLRWVLGQGSLLPLSQGEAFTLASISYLAILVKYILAKKKSGCISTFRSDLSKKWCSFGLQRTSWGMSFERYVLRQYVLRSAIFVLQNYRFSWTYAHCPSSPPPPPTKVHFLKYFKNALSYSFETFWLFTWGDFQNRYLYFNQLHQNLVTIETLEVDTCFWTTYFDRFYTNAPHNPQLFCYLREGCFKWNLLWKFGLEMQLNGFLVRTFILHSFFGLQWPIILQPQWQQNSFIRFDFW